jgi:transcription elongation factor GreA
VTKIEPTGKVIFGTTVQMITLDTEATVTYQIVGDDEADVSKGKISVSSPIARAMMGKFEGDEIVVKAPAGDVEYEIERVKHL